MQIKIFDNFLTKSYHEEILELMSGFNFPWYYNDNISFKKGNNNLNEYGFSHMFWTQETGQRNSTQTWFLKSALLQMLDVTECNSIVRSRADMTTYAGKEFIHEPHIDLDFPHIASIYYVNDSDGDTFMFDNKLNIKTRITPKKNRVVVFKGDILHSAGHPLKTNKRLVINFDFKV